MGRSKDEDQEQRAKDLEKANKDSVKAMEGVRQKKYDNEKAEHFEREKFESQREYAKVMDELRNRHKTGAKRQDGTDITHSDELLDMCKKTINADVQAYTDFRSNLNSMWQICAKFHEVNTIRAQQVAGALWNTDIKGVSGHKIAQWLDENSLIRLKSFLVHSVIKPHSDIDIPTLQQKVSFKDGKVTVDDLTCSDGTPLPSEAKNQVNQAFKVYVATWLAENNYVPHPDPNQAGKYIHRIDQSELDETRFKRLNEKPETSFSTFIKQTAALEYEEQQKDTPRPPI
jgi:hypothetical protein